jgi:HlyD family secretion protein
MTNLIINNEPILCQAKPQGMIIQLDKRTLIINKMKIAGIIISIVLMASACTNTDLTSDAYGNFEANEVLVSAEANGKILSLHVEEGKQLNINTRIGQIDTVLLAVNKEEIAAQKARIYANMANIEAQKQVALQQIENVKINQERITKLNADGAATQKQLDDIDGQVKVLQKQIDAYNAQKSAIAQELKVIEAKTNALNEKINKCTIVNPAQGTVLEKYAETGEITAMGKPLYKLADLQDIILRVYVTGGQLNTLKLNQQCQVLIDKGEDDWKKFTGTIQWISTKAEFTPKIIQTKEERVSLVYAVKIIVPNDGSIKIGMPGEVVFNE